MICDYISCSQSLTGNTITEALPLLLWKMKAEPFIIHSHTEYGNEKTRNIIHSHTEYGNDKMKAEPSIIHSHTEYGNEKRENFLTFRFTNIALITESITVATQGIAMALPVNFRMV